MSFSVQAEIVENGQLKKNAQMEKKIDELQRMYKFKTMKEIISECKPLWGDYPENEGLHPSARKENKGVAPKGVATKAFKEDEGTDKRPSQSGLLGTSVVLPTDSLFDIEDVIVRVEKEGGKLNQRDKKNLRKKLKKSIKNIKKNHPELRQAGDEDDDEDDAEDEEKPKGKGGAKAKAAEVKQATQAAPAAEVVQAPVEPVKSKESLGIVLDNGELIFPPKDPYE